MEQSQLSRRDFLQGAAAISGFLLIGCCPSQYGPNGPTTVFVRKSAHSAAAAQDVAAYAAAVQVMKQRGPDDRTSWSFQANMHGTFQQATTPDQITFWKKCEHGTLYFLSWHRMYLYYFEKIVRKASGNPNFALPYWKYETDTERSLPDAFRLPAASSNSLYEPNRDAAINGGTPLPAVDVSHTVAFDDQHLTFAPSGLSVGFSSELEGQPHGMVHVDVGGLMGSVPTAAQDPIFWLHHANIDRLWKRWLDLGNGRQNPADATWLNKNYSFVDENGSTVSLSGSQVLDTVSQLHYRYDDDPPVAAGSRMSRFAMAHSGPVVVLAATTQPVIRLTQEAVIVKVPLTPQAADRIRQVNVDPATPPRERFVLRLEGMTADEPPDANFEVYLDLPADEKNPTPNLNNFVGNLTFFGLSKKERQAHTHGEATGSRSYDITDVVRALKSKGQLDADHLRITVIPQHSVGARSPEDRRTINPAANAVVGKISVLAGNPAASGGGNG